MYTKIVYRDNVSRKVKKHKTIITSVVVLVTLLLILSTDLSPDLYFINLGTAEDVSCHYKTIGDALKPLDEHFAPASNSIFFHETSCRGGLDSRHACAVESAARAHPDREIYVIFSGPVNKISFEDVSLDLLKKFSNINFRRVFTVEYAKGTPIDNLMADGALNRTRWPVTHTSDVLVFLTLYKWGGVVLDLDTVVAKPLDDLPMNWAAREDDVYVATSALAFYRDELGRMVADAALRDLSNTFRGDVWGQNGPFLLTRVLKDVCATNDVTAMSADRCKGFEVFGPEFCYPVGAEQPQALIKDLPGQDPYIYRIRNRQTKELKVKRNSLYAKLAKQHCPVVYETFGEFFGS